MHKLSLAFSFSVPLLLMSAASAQDTALFRDLSDNGERQISEQEHSERPSVRSEFNIETGIASINAEWIYLRDIAQEYTDTASIARLSEISDTATISAIGKVASNYIQRYNDDSLARKSRMCREYATRLESQGAHEAAEIAFSNLETTDELIARRKALGESFLETVFNTYGSDVMDELINQANKLGSQVDSYMVSTTRDMMESIGADKITYIERSCK